MSRAQGNPSNLCLDAETLAAWADDGLLPQERRMAEAHLAGCSRCRLVIATLARTEPEAVVTTEPVADVEEVLPWWQRGWTLGWLVPLTAAAAAFGLWMVMPGDSTLPVEVSQQAEAPRSAEPAYSSRLEPATPAAAPPPARSGSGGLAPAPEALREAEAAKAQSQTAAGTSVVEERQAFAAPPQEPAPFPDASADLAASRPDTRARAEQAVGGAAPPPPQPAAAPRTANDAAGATAVAPAAPAAAQERVLLNRLAPTITIQSPDGSSRWRVTAERIEHSADGGATWTVQRDEPATIASGDAPTAQICWLVGPGGVVLITTDGRTWRERQTPLPVDLAGIDAIDANRATVVARDGRRFSTTDGGVSWSDSSLQGF